MLILVDYGEILTFLAMGFASVLALAVGAERTILFKANSSDKNKGFLDLFIQSMRNGDMESARSAVKQSTESIYTRFGDFALNHYSKGSVALSGLLQGQVIKEKIELEKRLPILNTLGNNAPFIGLLGTVLGIIKAFFSLGTLGNSGAEVVMKNISTALLATAAGLFIAIPVVMANNFFSKKLKVIEQTLEILSKEILASLTSQTSDFIPAKKEQAELPVMKPETAAKEPVAKKARKKAVTKTETVAEEIKADAKEAAEETPATRED